MKIEIPECALLVLVGASGAGKSTFAARHFLPTEIVSSDACRALVADDPEALDASNDAFEVLHTIVDRRLARQRLTVVDATNVQAFARKRLVGIARDNDTLAVAVVLDLPLDTCLAHNDARTERRLPPRVIRKHRTELRRAMRTLKREGFSRIVRLRSRGEVDAAELERTRLWVDRRDECGPFDIIGDVHGCRSELERLLGKLGYVEAGDTWQHPEGRRAVFVGDLVDRGPDSPGVLRIVMAMVAGGSAIAVPGNHDAKLLRKLDGRDVRPTHGLAETLAQLESCSTAFVAEVRDFLRSLVSHGVFDGGALVVAHAGLPAALQGRASRRVREFALYGDTTGEVDELGLPVRGDWAAAYRGRARVVYGHTPTPEASWVNRTICLDTGCVFGGKLSALRYPELELVDEPAEREWWAPIRPLDDPATAGDRPPARLDMTDVAGRRTLTTRFAGRVLVTAEQSAAALETMARFAIDPRWLIYLPPTMSPARASKLEHYLEHPAEAFAYYREHGVAEVVCQTKHMGSRAVAVVARSPEAAGNHFGDGSRRGVVYTRTGRPFFTGRHAALEGPLVDRIAAAMDAAGLWDELSTEWICLDAELLPWSAKAGALIHDHYAQVGAAGALALSAAQKCVAQATTRHGLRDDAESVAALEAIAARLGARAEAVERYERAWARYCWPTDGLDQIGFAPFHVMATAGRVWTDVSHAEHLAVAARLAAADATGLVRETEQRVVDTTDPASEAAATAWWTAQTAAGAEGMVVKSPWLARGTRGLVQPALKVRGREYLRIIYGPDYAMPQHLDPLRTRRLGTKRKLARKEFALGLEALARFVAGEPLYRVHECVFAVLALESEPVDARL